MTERYEFWTHLYTGDTWAVRLDERGLVSGCSGPLEPRDLRRTRLLRLAYDPEPTDWLNVHAAEFVVRDDVE